VERPESIAEHSWHVAFLVLALAPSIERIDVRRAIEIALVHDLAELRLGDLPRTAARYLPAGAKKEAERAALTEILAPLGARALDLAAEYEAGETAEARLVKACDKLQLMLKVGVYQRWGTGGGLAEFWSEPSNFEDGGFPEVAALFAELRERFAT
jgi:putative hydrolase of HD superfamily